MTQQKPQAAAPAQLTPLQHSLIVSGNPSCPPLTARTRQEIKLFPIQRSTRPAALPRSRKKQQAPWGALTAIALAVLGVIAATAALQREAEAKRPLGSCAQLTSR